MRDNSNTDEESTPSIPADHDKYGLSPDKLAELHEYMLAAKQITELSTTSDSSIKHLLDRRLQQAMNPRGASVDNLAEKLTRYNQYLRKCRLCKTITNRSDVFCPKCGSKLGGVEDSLR